MAGTSARNAAIYVNGADLSTYFRQVGADDEIDLEDTTTFGSTVTAKAWTALLKGAKLALGGFWDSTASVGATAVLHAALAAAAKAIVCVFPIAETTGGKGLALRADESALKKTFPVEGVHKIEAEFQSSVGIEPITSLHAKGQETAGGTGTTVDNAAATTNGGAVYLQVFDVGTTMTVVVRHSTDNFAADDTVLDTFTAVTIDNKAERRALTGTIKRYVRITWTQTGNTTFSSALHRR